MNEPLDRIDRQILTLLQNDARLSNKELAGRIGLAPSTCHTRVQRLLEVGAIRGFHAEVDPRALGVNIQALLMLRLTHHTKADWDAIADHLAALDEVVDVFHIAGSEDLLLRVAAADTEHLRRLNVDKLSSRKEVNRVHTFLVFEHRHRSALPDLTSQGSDPLRAP